MTGWTATLPAPEFPAGRRLALVVATSRYTDKGLRALRAPAQDVEDLTRVLSDPEIGGFKVRPVMDAEAQTVRLAIEEQLSECVPTDLLLVYISCHGLRDARGRLYFAATDTIKNRLAATGVEADWLLEQLEDCRARQQVLVLDCCFSGAFAAGSKSDSDLGLGRLHGSGRGRAVLTASRASEYSFEGTPVPGQAMPGSVFTGALIAGLRSGAADVNRDGYISVDDAYAYAFDRVSESDAEQTPQRWLYGAEGEIYLARSRSGREITPAPLPDGIRTGLDSPYPDIRLGAVGALASWLADADPSRVLAAQLSLQAVSDTDVVRVADAARAYLRGRQPSNRPIPRGQRLRENIGTIARLLRRPFGRTAALATALVILTVLGALLLPAFFPVKLTNDQLVVPMLVGDTYDLFLADVTRSAPGQRLTDSGVTDVAPNISPNRDRIMYRQFGPGDDPGQSSIRLMAIDGSEDRLLFSSIAGRCAGAIARPAWNPKNPDELAVVCRDSSGLLRIHLVTLSGEVTRSITLSGVEAGDVTFSPEGETLAFWMSTAEVRGDGGALYLLDVARGSSTRLTDSDDGVDTDPAWSADGRTIAFSRLVDVGTDHQNRDIFAVRVDRSAPPVALTDGDADDAGPSFSPRDDLIAYASAEPIESLPAVGRVWVMRSDGSDKRVLWRSAASDRARQGAPTWSRR